MLLEDGIDVGLVSGLDAAKDHVLLASQPGVQPVLVHDLPQGGLELEITLVLNAALLNVDTQEKVAVSLLVPAKPVDHPPLRKGDRGLDGLAQVTLHELAEVVDAEGVDQVLEASVGADLTVTVVTLGGEDSLAGLSDVLLGHVAKVFGNLGEGALLVVGTAHAASDEDVISHQVLASLVHDHHQSNVVDEDVNRVVSGNSDSHLELTGKVGAAVEGLLGVSGDDAGALVLEAVPGDHLFKLLRIASEGRDVVLSGASVDQVLVPVLDGSSLLAVKPELKEGRAAGLQEIGQVVGGLEGILVGLVTQGGGRGHDVPVDVSAASEGRASSLGNAGNHVLEVVLLHTVELPGLASGGTEVTLSVIG
mmetsp:Transcript_49480/g.77306  ORF Transcript_49480/g.77306 Transcript_49480/m.77306 type:complete len:364 (+) Transcript_49480:803-1894(+)